MNNWHRDRLNPVELMRKRGWPCDHVTYDPKLRKGDYSIVRGSTHDGTYAFTLELINEPLALLAAKRTFHKPRETEFISAKEVRYTVGPMRLATVMGRVKLPCSKTSTYPGERQRLRMPVRMHCG